MSESHYFSAGDRVRVTGGCNAGKFGKVKKLGHGNMFVQCEPEGVGWYTPDEVALVVTADETPLVPEDVVNHPSHYTSSPAKCSSCGTGIECIDITEHMGFSIGNAVKYLWRADLKGNAIEDLRKSVWYIQREIAKREGAKP